MIFLRRVRLSILWQLLSHCLGVSICSLACAQNVQPAGAAKKIVQLTRDVPDTSAGDLRCYRIETPTATYYLDQVGAGLSSMIDRDGNDWIGFHPERGSGARGEYRGFPNAVFKEEGSYFHPRNAGTDPSITTVMQETPERVVIAALSSNGLWAGEYVFTELGCTFTLTKKPTDHPYWILYEGVPGGSFDKSDWWITPTTSEIRPVSELHEGDIADQEWIAFGDAKCSRVLFMMHHQDDQAIDRYYPMQDSMTVFGFGRNGMQKLLNNVPRSFTIGFVESTQPKTIARRLSKLSEAWALAQHQDQRRVHDQIQALQQYALTHVGDAQSGRRLFLDEQRTKCSTCHRVGGKGGQVGPDLSKIGNKFDRPHLIESLLEPSRQIVEGYRASILLTEEGKVHTGVIRKRNQESIELVTAANERLKLSTADIVKQTDASVSIMPSGLAEIVTPEEFVDLVAYLETLRTGKAKFGSGVTGPIELPDGFQIATVATGISGATALEVMPDGRVLVCEQDGRLRVVKDEQLLETPMVTIPVEHNWERGLIGVTVAPTFPEDPFVYCVSVRQEPFTHHRVSRFRVHGDTVIDGSEQVLLVGDDQSKFGGNVPAGHQGGAIHFGNDGKLYIGIGEQTAGTPAQDMKALQGKILRINPDGSIPKDNPFWDQADGKYRTIWAKGCRNPFTFAVSRATGEILINDVGGKYEEINRGIAGANYGWPRVDHGPTDAAGMTGPIHIYPQASISGGAFCESDAWPEAYRGQYFFADFVHGWIKVLDPSAPAQARTFAEGLRRVVDMRFATDGSLYVLLRNAWVVDDKFEGGTGALMKITYSKVN